MKLKIILALVLLSALGTLSAESWTVLVYMAADNNLAQMGALDINSMESVLKPAGLTVIVQADFPEGAKRYHIRKDDSEEITSYVIANLGDIDSGDPQTLNDFIKWGFINYPAQRKMLVIWSHGDSWYKEIDSKWICPDDGAESLMSIADGDLNRAFEGIPKLDILLFDACSMQSIEVITQVAEYTDYVIASEELVPQYGFPYELIIPVMGADLNTILLQIPQLYMQSYLPGGGINPGPQEWTTTCSSIYAGGLPGFLDLFRDAMMPFQDSLATVRDMCYEMNTGLADVDVRQLFRIMEAEIPINNYFRTLSTIWDYMVVSSAFSSPDPSIENIGTAAIWFPDNRFNFDNAWQRYRQLDFAKTLWLMILNATLGDDHTPPERPELISATQVRNRLLIKLKQVVDPDMLLIEMNLSESIYPAIGAADPWAEYISIETEISKPGTYELWFIDQAGNKSETLTGAYSWSEPQSTCWISPNPIRHRGIAALNWLLSSNVEGSGKAEFYNLRGQKVMDINLGTAYWEGMELLSTHPEFNNLAAGIYIVKLSIGKQKITTKMTILY